jgi:HSP20 family protein
MAKQSSETATEKRGGLIPWRPLAEMSRWQRDMERMFGNFFTGRVHPLFDERWWPGSSLGPQESSLDLDLYEDKDAIVVKAELPGMSKDDIQISITDNVLTIKGEKKKQEADEGQDYYRAERVYGSFIRTVSLPTEINPEKVQATFRNGVLEIRLPKSEQAKKKEIKVKVDR